MNYQCYDDKVLLLYNIPSHVINSLRCSAVYMNYPKNEKELLDVEAVATAVKRILGNLPETILTRHLVLRLVNATSMLRTFVLV